MTREPRRIVFDFGRVLFRWRPEHLMRQCLPRRATDAARAAHWASQIFESYGGDWGEFDRGTIGPDEVAQRIARRTGLALADVHGVVRAALQELQPLPDSVALLRRLHHRGHRLYFLSNMPASFADQLQSSHDFMALFSDGVFSCRVRHIKPEAAIYRIAAERFGAQPQELVLLDDHGPNVEAAAALGWHALQFHDAAQAEAAMRAAGWA